MTAIPVRDRSAEPVLSVDQERLWLEHLLRPHAAYHVHGRRRLRGKLDVPALQRSVAAVVARHEALRTRFPVVERSPVQVVDEPAEAGYVELASVSSLDAALRLADEHAGATFDLARGPLLRCLLVELDDADHLLGVTMHHIVADAWSIDLFVGEVAELYRVGGDVTRARLPELPIQYLDYAVWQRGRLAGERYERDLAYWRRQLAGVPPALDLPAARRRTAGQGAVGGRVCRDLPGDQLAALHQSCRTQRATPFMVLLAALAVVLARWSGRTDVVVGVPTTVRDDSAAEHLIGLFVNTLPMRVDLSGRPSFSELLQRVRRVVLGGAVEHREAPLNALVDELALPRDPTRTPLVQVCLSMVRLADGVQLDDVDVEPVEPPALPSIFDLNLYVRVTADGVRLDSTFHADRYAPATVDALLDQLVRLLHAVGNDPDRGVFDYPLGDPPVPPGPVDAPGDRARERFGLTCDDRVAVLTDVPGQVATVLASVPTRCVPDDATVRDPGALVDFLRTHEVSVVYLAPPLLRAIAALGVAPLPELRCAFVHHDGGLTGHDAVALAELAPRCRMVTLYRVDHSGRPLAVYEVPDDLRPDTVPLRLPLGTEVDGDRVQLCNAAGIPAAACEVGQIPGTGDLARRLPDGTLELVGDTPDLLEMVTALRDRPDVDDVLVVECTGTAGTPGLAVYVASRAASLDTAVLRQHLVTHVPANMLPRTVTVVPRLPLTKYGEYDLAALPPPELA